MTLIKNQSSPWTVPKSWLWVAIGEIAETASGETPHRDEPRYFGGGIPWLKSGELRDGIIYETVETITKAGLKSSKATLCPKGTVCIARSGTIAGRLGILGLEAATNEAICAILPSKYLLPKYLFRFLELKRPALIASGTSVTQAHINLSNLRATLIPVPPIAEQRRISAEIDTRLARLDSGTRELRRALMRLKRYRSSVLAAAFKGRLVATGVSLDRDEDRPRDTANQFLRQVLAERRSCWETRDLPTLNAAGELERQRRSRARDIAPVAPMKRRRAGIPDGWVWATAEQLCSEITCGWEIQTLYEATGRPLVTAKNVRDSVVDFNGCGLISHDLFEGYKRRCSPQKNDILIVGEGLNIGRAAVVDSDTAFAIARNVLLMRPILASRFLLHWLRSPYCQSWIRRVAGLTARARLRLSNARRMPILLPPRDDQRRIVEEIDCLCSAANQLEAIVQGLQERAAWLRREILTRAFEGKLVT
jgi:type I restriction enzyme S subunit